MILIRYWKALLPLLVIVISLGAYSVFSGGEVPEDNVPTPSKQVELVPAGKLLEDTAILTTLGTVRSDQAVDVRAETSGQVVQVNVEEGVVVQAGQVLFTLERQVLDAQVLQAEARLAAAQANLAKLRNGDRPEDVEILEQKLGAERERLKEMERGSRPEEIAISETQLANAKKNLEDAKRELENSKEKAERDLQTSIEAGIDLLGTSAAGMEKILSQNLQDISYPIRFPKNETCQLRVSSFEISSIVRECFDALLASEEQRSLVQSLASQETALSSDAALQYLKETKNRLEKMRIFLNSNFSAVNGAIALLENNSTNSVSITDQELSNLKTLVTSAQAENNSLLNQVSNQIQAIMNQEVANQNAIDAADSRLTQSNNAVLSAENDLTLKKTGSTAEQLSIQQSQIRQLELQLQVAKQGARPEDIQSQQASVQQAQADVAVARANRDKAIIIAPISGTLIEFPYDIGDYINTNDIVASIANKDQLEVTTFITEDERQLVRIGAEVSLLDDQVMGTVSAISPALQRETKKIEVTITVTQGEELLVIGQTVFAGFQLTLPEGTLRIPVETVLVEGRTARVLSVNEENTVITLQVVPGEIIEDTIVVKGITPETLLISDPKEFKIGESVQVTNTELLNNTQEPTITELPTQLSPA